MAAEGLSVSGQGLSQTAINKSTAKPRGKLLLNPKVRTECLVESLFRRAEVTARPSLLQLLPRVQNPLVDAATAYALLEDKLASRFKSVKQAFINMDYDLDGKISSGEFRVTLDLMGLVMNDEEFVKLWAHFDADGNGALTYAEFNNKVGAMLHPPITRHVINRPQTPRVRQVNARKAAQGLAKRMANLEDAFKMIDSDGSGRISHAEFIQALRHVGLTKVSHDESYEMMVKVSFFKAFVKHFVNELFLQFKDADDMADGISFPQFKKAMESYLKGGCCSINV